MKYREEYDKQLLVKVNLAPFGDGIDVDRLIVLNYKLRLVRSEERRVGKECL